MTKLTALCLLALLAFGLAAGCRRQVFASGKPAITVHRECSVDETPGYIRPWTREARAHTPGLPVPGLLVHYRCSCGHAQWWEVVR